MKPKNPLSLLLSGLIALVVAPADSVRAADGSAPGSVEGRVLNTRSGEYVERARVTVTGTALETFTDSAGHYRLGPLPAGTAEVKVFFTGLGVQTQSVTVAAGETARRDFNLSGAGPGTRADKDGIVRLDQFVVGARREMEGAAIAINEQRFAPNMKNVVTVEEFGAVTEGNVAEVIKFLPGVHVSYGAGDGSQISVGGAPSAYTPITVGGFPLAAAASTSTGRQVEMEQFSINNIARVEVNHSPTPDSPAAALAGSVNMVTRSAFERSKPVFNGGVYLIGRATDLSFNKTPGPFEAPTHKIQPSFDFTYIRPVNERFGFTVSGGHNRQFSRQDQMFPTWRGTSAATNPAGDFPNTTAEMPYLTNVQVGGGDKFVTRSNIGTTIDFKLTRYDRFSFSYLYTEFENEYRNRNLLFLVGGVAPGAFSTSFTHGIVGRGEVSINVNQAAKHTETSMPTLTYRHDGPVWKVDAGLGSSYSTNYYYSGQRGFIGSGDARRTGLTVSFDEIGYLRPGKITVTDAAGAPVDANNLSNYVLTQAGGAERNSYDRISNTFVNAGRDVTLLGTTLKLKTGLDGRRQERDIHGKSPIYPFIGRDGRATTTPTDPAGSDDGAAVVVGENIAQRINQFGFGNIQWIDPRKLLAHYTANPSYFTENLNNSYIASVNASKRAQEDIVSAYVRSDFGFFNRRLRVVTGVRAEQTNIVADGPRRDPTLNYQRDSQGRVVLGSSGLPVPIVPTSDALGVSQRTLLERGTHVNKEYLRWFPNLNASFALRESLIVRAALYESIGRPDFNQYAGGVTLPDTAFLPSTGNRISVNNAGIKPWTAQSATARLEYYFGEVGQISVGGFFRNYENFFGSTTFTPTADFFALYGIDPDTYGAFTVATQYNITSSVRSSGYSIDYKQVLSFLPPWARGVQVFANMSAQRVTADPAARNSFDGFSPRNANWGISLTRPRYNLRLNWSYHALQRFGIVIAPNTFQWAPPRTVFDIHGEGRIGPSLVLFANIRNVNNSSDAREIYNPSTPEVARLRVRQSIGALVTVGVKGSF